MAAGRLRPGLRLGVTAPQVTRAMSVADLHAQVGRQNPNPPDPGIRAAGDAVEGTGHGASGEASHIRFNLAGAPEAAADNPQHAPVTEFSKLSRSDRQRITRHAKNLGLTAGVVRTNLHDLLDKANERAVGVHQQLPQGQQLLGEGPVPVGRDWYLTEHREIGRRASQVGVPQSHLTAATAALSPTVPWEAGGKKVNLNLAGKTAEMLHRDPAVTITREHADHLHADQTNNPSSYAGRNPVDWHSLVGTHRVSDLPSHVVATLGSFSGRGGTFRKKNNDGTVTEKPDKTFRGAGLEPMHDLGFMAQARNRQNVTKAVDILRSNTTAGEALSPLGSPKPRTFNDNLSAPYANPARATIDRWAIRGASGTTNEDDKGVVGKMKVNKGTKKEAKQGLPQASDEAQSHGMYLYLQHHMAHVAAQRGMHAQEAQAVAWTQVKGEHEGHAQFGSALPHEQDFAKQQKLGTPNPMTPGSRNPFRGQMDVSHLAGGTGVRRMPGDDLMPEGQERERAERASSAIGKAKQKKAYRDAAPERMARQRARDAETFGR